MNKEVKIYFDELEKWKPELTKLREIILECGLKEEYKWRNPCYTDNGKNIVLIGCAKEFCSISFLKGELLKDSKSFLQKVGQNTRSAKYISFETLEEIKDKEETLKNYIQEAIENERKGLKIDYAKDRELEFPDELIEKFSENPEFENAFTNLTKGRQRGYVLHFSGAKQSKTRTNRIKKYQERIFKGKGMLDCVCGLSKRMPNCDGSHKQLENVE